MTDITTLSATEIAKKIADKTLNSVDVVAAFLARIDARELNVGAFVYLDRDYALEQAARCDEARRRGVVSGRLHGVPVAVKDIIDTGDMPTQNGLALDQGRRAKDAFVVRQLRAAGAVILGKTTTTEAAYYHPTKTRNPHNLAHTPGGSSAGSAASVADRMVPLAIGSQTNGSVIRPAAFCGVVGFKPGRGQIARTGALKLSPTLDQLGTFANSIEDAALLADVLTGSDDVDESVLPAAASQFQRATREGLRASPSFAFVLPPDWEEKAPDFARAAFSDLCDRLDGQVERVDMPLVSKEGLAMHWTVMAVEMSHNLARYGRADKPISDHLRLIIDKGAAVTAGDYLAALDFRRQLFDDTASLFTRYDAILTPSSFGAAPASLENTGDPACCSLWTLAATPAISLPLLKDENNMPMGVQLVGPRGGDSRLLQIAVWLSAWCQG